MVMVMVVVVVVVVAVLLVTLVVLLVSVVVLVVGSPCVLPFLLEIWLICLSVAIFARHDFVLPCLVLPCLVLSRDIWYAITGDHSK